MPNDQHTNSTQNGSALIMVLWTVIIMSLLIGTFAYEMHIEAKIATLERQRFKSQEIARAGFEYARAILSAPELTEEAETTDVDEFQSAADRISSGLDITSIRYSLPDGAFTISIENENSKRNISDLSDDEWTILLDACGVPITEIDELIACYTDWTDEGDLHELNGAESDDDFYVEQGYGCKNAALECIEELLLIKNFTPAILYGETNPDEDSSITAGLCEQLTVWGDGKVNINSASRETLMSFIDLNDTSVDSIIDLRNGLDGEPNTDDDGFASLSDVGLSDLSSLFTTSSDILRITSRATTENFIYEIQTVVYQDNNKLQVLFWSESFLAPEPNETEPSQKESFSNL